MIRAVIYDMDDLMVNAYAQHNRAFELTLKRHGKSMDDIDKETQRHFIGRRVIDITREAVKYLHIDADPNEMYKERNRIFLELVKKDLKAMPGLRKSLRLIKKNGLKIAIASSGTKEYIQTVVDKFRIKGYFDAVISGNDVARGKPHPETYIRAAKKLRTKPGECMVLEDATMGIMAAKAAGCFCIAVRNPFTMKQDLTGADLVVDSLSALNRTHLLAASALVHNKARECSGKSRSNR